MFWNSVCQFFWGKDRTNGVEGDEKSTHLHMLIGDRDIPESPECIAGDVLIGLIEYEILGFFVVK